MYISPAEIQKGVLNLFNDSIDNQKGTTGIWLLYTDSAILVLKRTSGNMCILHYLEYNAHKHKEITYICRLFEARLLPLIRCHDFAVHEPITTYFALRTYSMHISPNVSWCYVTNDSKHSVPKSYLWHVEHNIKQARLSIWGKFFQYLLSW